MCHSARSQALAGLVGWFGSSRTHSGYVTLKSANEHDTTQGKSAMYVGVCLVEIVDLAECEKKNTHRSTTVTTRQEDYFSVNNDAYGVENTQAR